MATKKGYKVVTETPIQRLLSATSLGKVTEYHVGANVCRTEEQGPFAVFDEYDYAKNFCASMDWSFLKIYEIEYTPSAESELWYKKISHRVMRSGIYKIPVGTKFADSVKLIRKMDVAVEPQGQNNVF